jgi:hypothetical protein
VGRIALLDGDEAAYIASCYTQKNWWVVRNENGTEQFRGTRKRELIERIGSRKFTMEEEFEQLGIEPGLARLRKWITDTLEAVNCTEYRMVLNGDDNFRYELATITPYKDRDQSLKPKLLPDIKDFLVEKYKGESVNYLESDDLLAVIQSTSKPGSTVICCQDKDLNMIPGWRYFTHKGELKLLEDDFCIKSFYGQLLTGDPVDSIPGLYGVGPKTVEKLLAPCVTELDHYEVVLKTYKEKMGHPKQKWKTDLSHEKVIWEIGNLLWMRRELGLHKYWEAPVER